MTDHSAPAVVKTVAARGGRLEADAIGVAQDTVIGMASSAPAASVGLTIAGLAAATAYGSGAIILITVIPMVIIANAYRRLNIWNANCGASFEWVGRAINPYLGWMTGWLMIAAYIIATVSGVEVLGPAVLSVFGDNSTALTSNVLIAVALGLVMLIIAIVGIKITARTQVGIAAVEYIILIGFAIAGLAAVLGHRHGTMHFSADWFSVGGIGGKGSAVAGFLIAVFMYTGWDGTLYVNEEVRQRRTNPGKAAVIAVLLLAVIYTFSTVGLQGVVSAGGLQANADSPLTYIAQSLAGGGWAKVMALALALSVIATTGTGIVLTSRIVYGMASYRALPEPLANVSRRFSTPVTASVVVGLLIIILSVVYLVTTSVQNAFDNVVDVTGLLFGIFYILTALATIVYYRRRLTRSVTDALTLGILPVGAAIFLGYIVVKFMLGAAAVENWSMVGVIGVGIIVMLLARFWLKSPFFQIRRESDPA
jgi:amino acid transporter